MTEDKQYIEIPIRDLPMGKSTLEFDLDDEFFKKMSSDIFGGDMFFDFEIERLSSYINVEWSLEGSVNVECDRCLEEATLDDITSEGNFVIKLDGEHNTEKEDDSNEDIMHAYSSDNNICLDKYCFDSIYLALPIQRVHANTNAENSCNPEMLKFIQKAN